MWVGPVLVPEGTMQECPAAREFKIAHRGPHSHKTDGTNPGQLLCALLLRSVLFKFSVTVNWSDVK